ncbi:hypothetical protein [Polyangium spumosum]|uniref:Uncharacterized protein n=1 Tax=Polyangium spumosum TaxID=889282 RepID=A0A6N7PI20_9BACT|nr:hypothetical protein [Polyangium spumosum]MRG91733.1 hypothetical protein [Polyangium spumosum]
MNKLGLFGAAAVASALCFGAAPAMASDGDVAGAALDLVAANATPGNGAAFVTKAIKNAFALNNAAMTYYWGATSPGSSAWYTAITTADNFVEITNIADVAAGQILAIDGSHTVVIIGDPIDITPPTEFYTPYITGTTQWALPIADSTSSAHGFSPAYYDGGTDYSDSRWSSSTDPNDPNNVIWTFTGSKSGTAYMRLYADEVTGEITAHAWSVTATSEAYVYDQTERPFAIGECTL